MQSICLDTGVLDLLLADKRSKEIQILQNEIVKKQYKPYVMQPTLCELFYHQCKANGKEVAKIQISSLVKKLALILVELDESTIFLAGTLKCQHFNSLSYIDCISIAYCLNNGYTFHTTEKLLKKTPQNTLDRLKLVTYVF
jgi:predicted nucleic acid-binding protein